MTAVQNATNTKKAPRKERAKKPAKQVVQTNVDEIDEADEAEIARRNSVVSASYKRKYIERAMAKPGIPKAMRKAAKRSTWDWLAQQLAERTLDEKKNLRVADFEAILDANGVAHSHWNRTTRGWQGRLRMTGRLALQRVVAESGELVLPDGSKVVAPRTWVQKHQH